MSEIRLIKNCVISGKLSCMTGLHIGGVADTSQIGGVDSPVIIDPVNKIPYIPGSSLKGKIRSLIELRDGLANEANGKTHNCPEENCLLCRIFGRGASESEGLLIGPTRLIVRDAMPTKETIEAWKQNEKLSHGTEVKAENTINRLTSKANPRFMERVPSGSKFDFEFVLSIYTNDDENIMMDYLKEGMRLLQDNYLGGYGSRGSGRVVFEDIHKIEKTSESYKGRESEAQESAFEL